MINLQQYQQLQLGNAQPQPQLTQAAFIPPSQGGINALSGVVNVDPADALYLYNMIPQEYGTGVRKGTVEWCDPIPLGDGVKTIIPFNAPTTDTVEDKLFAATSNGVYDITVEGGTPTLAYEWPAKTTRSGWCSWHYYTTAAGPFLLLCDLENGYTIYDGSADTWEAGTIQGPEPAETTLDFVTVWKNRVWLVEQSSGRAWYLPVGQINGAATSFDFGNKFKYGGYLKGLYNWTIDGGEGVDDYLVAISEGGDVVVYKGNDPSTAGDFRQQGYWWIGRVPRNRRVASSFGGDLLVLSTFGVIQMSKLIAGLPVTDEQVSISHKINPRINTVMSELYNEFGWEMRVDPREQLMFLATPKVPGRRRMQFAYNTATRGWCQLLDIPYLTGESYGSDFYIGTEDNRIFRYIGYNDNVLIEDDGASAEPIDWEIQTSYQNFGLPAIFKRVQFLRPVFIADANPSYYIRASYDFDLTGIPSAPPQTEAGVATWGDAVWDFSKWGGSLQAIQPPTGGKGIGRYVSVVIRGRTTARTLHVGTDVMMDSGGML